MSVESYVGMIHKYGPEAANDEVLLGERLAAFRRTLRESGIRLTPQRLEVFCEVAGRGDHPDAETVFREVRRRMPTVSLDTVHRTLQLLKDLGLVVPLGPRHESVRFDANLDYHHHYICARCGLVRDFQSAGLTPHRIPEAAKRFGSVVSTRVEVRGICESCTKEKAERSVRGNPKQPQGERRRT